MKVIKNGKILQNATLVEDKAILFTNTIIDYINIEDIPKDAQVIDAKGNYVLPAFVDVHTHGSSGFDVMDATFEALEEISKAKAKDGVASFCPTTMTMPMDNIYKALTNIRNSIGKVTGAKIIGAHVEGPFISAKFKGAQPEDSIVPVCEKLIDDFIDIIKIITIAPETDNAIETIKKYSDKINFSLGHTGATFDQASIAFEAGATSATHLFNGMLGLHHREPGTVGAALSFDNYVELIADTVHVNKNLYPLILKAKTADKILLITDSIAATNMKDGLYNLGGQEISVTDGTCILVHGGNLAGSTLNLNKAYENFVQNTSLTLLEGSKIVSTNQANYLNMKTKGDLMVGKDADIVILSEDFEVLQTISLGESIYVK